MERPRLPLAPERSAASAHLPVGPASPAWRRFDRLVVGLVLAGLCLPWVLLVGGLRPKPLENRPLVAMPTLTVEGLANGSWFKGVDAFLADNIAVRSYAVRIRAEAIARSGGTGNPGVVRGLGSWLFAREEFEPTCLYPVATISDALGRAAASLASAGRTFRFVAVPDKGAIYPNELRPDNPFPPSCAAVQRPALRATLAKLAPAGIDGWSELAAARAADPSALLYFQGDTHWTPLGATALVRALITSIDPKLWSDADVQLVGTARRTVDLALLVGLRRIETVPRVVIRPTTPVTRADLVVPVEIHNARAVFRTAASGSASEPVVPGRTLIIYDSFFGLDTGLVAPFFADATWIHIGDAQNQPQLTSLLGPFDTVIVERVERGLYETDLPTIFGPLEQSTR